MQWESQFKPGDYVQVHKFGLGYQGRIERVIFRNASFPIYEIEYTCDGSFFVREFFEDELTLTVKLQKRESIGSKVLHLFSEKKEEPIDQ